MMYQMSRMGKAVVVLVGVFYVVSILAFCTGGSNGGGNPTGYQPSDSPPQNFTICSFNVQFVGNSKERDNKALAEIVSGYDIVVVQEVVSLPFEREYSDGKKLKKDKESAEFFKAMKDEGFVYEMSWEDTGPGEKNHKNGASTEWFVVFYKPEFLSIDPDLPTGYIAEDLTKNPDYDRVPHAFGFRNTDGNLDFVLISVHLRPGPSSAAESRRQHELDSIAQWVADYGGDEKDFIILGDMNIEDEEELIDDTPDGFLSLNDECRPTNTNVNGPKPYDHVMYRPEYTTEVDTDFDFEVVDLAEAVEPYWDYALGDFPAGENYNHDLFRKYYSDHQPVLFKLNCPDVDDD